MFRGFEIPRNLYGWWFFKLNYHNKGTGNNSGVYKTLSKVSPTLMHLQVNMPQNKCKWGSSKLVSIKEYATIVFEASNA